MSGPDLPADVAVAHRQLEEAEVAARALVAPLDEAALNWQPDGGRAWSVGQCLDHVAATNRVYGGSLRAALEGARREGRLRRDPIRPGWFARFFLSVLEPPVGLRVPARKLVQPASRHAKDDVLARFLASQDEVRALLREGADLDLQGVRFENPLGPFRFTVGTGFFILAAHARRHLWQARGVVDRLPGGRS